ncbi:MAG: cytochrome D1 domain-containing protein [Polyangiaceae bacterium]
MSIARVAVLACALALTSACSSTPQATVPAGSVGASIAFLSGKNQLAVVNPDQGSISIVNADSLAILSTVDVGGEPRALLELASGKILVTNSRGGEIVLVDPVSASVVKRKTICDGPSGLAASPDESFVVVACEWDGSVVKVDPSSLDASVLATGLARPRAVAVVGNAKAPSVIVSEFTGGNVVRIAADGTVSRVSLVPTSAPYRDALTKMTGNLAAALVPANGNLLVAYELVNHTGDASLEKIAGDYGSVTDGNPKINPVIGSLGIAADGTPTLSGDTLLYSIFDGGSRVFNGPVAVASWSHYEIVANISTNNVAMIDTNQSDPKTRAVGNISVGAGPSGVAVDQAHGLAYVDNAFDGSISKIDLAKSATLPHGPTQPLQTQIRTLSQPFSASARAGRKIFYDASNTHVTPSGVVACATCHPGGADDGLIWFIETTNIPLKRRRTPSLWNAHTATAPFHWNGQYKVMDDLAEATITDLMAGDGLLVDLPSVQAYIDEMVQPPVAPAGDANAIARGKILFESADTQCSTCHSGADFTDDQLHAVLNPMSLSADDSFSTANTPALHGLFLRAPYFHDGRSPSLKDLLTRTDASAHGKTSQLASSDVSDLVAYLNSL